MKRAPLIVLAVCAAGFAFGLFQLFRLRFELGDVYPPYSSLRADPLGTMALCESLEKIPRLSVTRDFTTANRLPEGPHTTYLHLAAHTEDWHFLPPELVQEIESFLSRGGRLAITFFPETAKPSGFFPGPFITPVSTNKPSKTGKQSSPAKSGKKKNAKNLEELLHQTSLKEKWGLDYNFVPLAPGEDQAYKPAPVTNQTD